MKKSFSAIIAIAALGMTGCSSVPEEATSQFTYESKAVEFIIESKVNDGDAVELFNGTVQFVPNYAVSPFQYESTNNSTVAIPYRFKEGVVDGATCEQSEGVCHFHKVNIKEGVEFQVTFFDGDKFYYEFAQHEIVDEFTFRDLVLPLNVSSSATGVVTMGDSGIVHDGMSVHHDQNGDEIVYETQIKYRTLKL